MAKSDEVRELLEELATADEEVRRLHEIIDSQQAEIDTLKGLKG